MESWNQLPRSMNLVSKIRTTRRNIARWKRVHDVNSEVEIQSLKTDLATEFQPPDPHPTTIKLLKQRLSRAYHQEEIYWKIKSRNQ